MHVVLIPALEPDGRLVELVRALRARDPERAVVVVDDGSGPDYDDVFGFAADAGARVIGHRANRGKGAALRTGLAAIAESHPGAHVVTADADGQHTPDDIDAIAARTEHENRRRQVVVLGVRGFDGDVPARSRIGNTLMRGLYRTATGTALTDTQTGLRGLPAAGIPWLLTLPGDRFEYEFHMLLRARRAGVVLVEQRISTVYTDGNASSHFRPVRDSLRVAAPLIRFAGSALLAFSIDTTLLLVVHAVTGNLLFSVIAARLVSASVNFAVNRALVFRRGREVPVPAAALRYLSLAVLLLAANFGALTALTDAGVPLLAAKLLTESALFVVSFGVQRSVVFAPAAPGAPGATVARNPIEPRRRMFHTGE